MKTKVYNKKGGKKEEMNLSDAVFDLPLNQDLLWQAVTIYEANKRRGTAHTKTRDEVSGGGRKPWPQKGTGRARHGSIRSPLWVGGGTAFGPRKDKKWGKTLPQKMKKKALAVALSSKVRDNELFILDKVEIAEPKTKLMADFLAGFKKKVGVGEKETVLLVLAEADQKLKRAIRNIPEAKIRLAQNINALDVLKTKHVFLTKEAAELLNKKLEKI